MLRWAHFRISDATANYLDKCARIRNISRTCLINRLLDVVAEDQMVGGILDDSDTILQRRPGERYFKGPEAAPGVARRAKTG